MKIFIPTFGRPTSQITWDSLPESIRRITSLVVCKEEAGWHLRNGRRVIYCNCQGQGMAAVRQWVLNYAIECGTSKFLMLDDDIVPQVKVGNKRVLAASCSDIEAGVDWVDRTLNTKAHCAWGVRTRILSDEFNLVNCSEIFCNYRATQAVGYNVEKVEASEAAFDYRVPTWFFMEDFHMTLQLLRAGFDNVVSLLYRFNCTGSNSVGGCLGQRTPGRQKEAALLLESLHRPFVRAVEKTTKQAWGGGTRWDVTVQWKKAFESSKVPT